MYWEYIWKYVIIIHDPRHLQAGCSIARTVIGSGWVAGKVSEIMTIVVKILHIRVGVAFAELLVKVSAIGFSRAPLNSRLHWNLTGI